MMLAFDLLDDLFEPYDAQQFQSWAPCVVVDERVSFISACRPVSPAEINSICPFGGGAFGKFSTCKLQSSLPEGQRANHGLATVIEGQVRITI